MGCMCGSTNEIESNPESRRKVSYSDYDKTNKVNNKPVVKNNQSNQDRNIQVLQSLNNRGNNQNRSSNQNQSQQNNQVVNRDNARDNRENRPSYEGYLESKKDPNFNLPQLDSYIGSGLKKIRAFYSNIEKDDLEKKRKDFWSSKFEGNSETWAFLQNVCTNEFGEEDLKQFMQAMGVKPYYNCINVVFDSTGYMYELPNYVIHDPVEYRIEKYNKSVPDRINLKLRVQNGGDEVVPQVNNLMDVISFKKLVAEDFGLGKYKPGEMNFENIRLFYSGKEMKNEDKLYMHDVEDEGFVMLLYRN